MKYFKEHCVCFVYIAITILLVGCTTLDAKRKKPEQPILLKTGKKLVTLTFIRSFYKTVNNITVFVDNKRVASLKKLTYTSLSVRPGKHTVKVKAGWGVPEMKFEVNITSDQYIGLAAKPGRITGASHFKGSLKKYTVSPEQAHNILKSHRKIESQATLDF